MCTMYCVVCWCITSWIYSLKLQQLCRLMNVFHLIWCVTPPRCWQPIRYQCRLLSNTVTCQWGWAGTLNPLCIAICIQLQLVLTRSLYNKQSAGQIKIMAITDAGLHILSAAKVRAESMNASVEAGGGYMKQGLLSLSLFIFPPSPGSLRIYQALISSVLVWVTALSRRYWWNGSGSCSVSLA